VASRSITRPTSSSSTRAPPMASLACSSPSASWPAGRCSPGTTSNGRVRPCRRGEGPGRSRFGPGAVVAVPLVGGGFGALQVVARAGRSHGLVALADVRAPSTELLAASLEAPYVRAVAAITIDLERVLTGA
jgi:hypothetical protein